MCMSELSHSRLCHSRTVHTSCHSIENLTNRHILILLNQSIVHLCSSGWANMCSHSNMFRLGICIVDIFVTIPYSLICSHMIFNKFGYSIYSLTHIRILVFYYSIFDHLYTINTLIHWNSDPLGTCTWILSIFVHQSMVRTDIGLGSKYSH